LIPTIRQLILDKLHKQISDPDVRGLVSALVLGIRELSRNNTIMYQQAGISHLIAISGLHIGLIAGLFYLLSYYLLSFLNLNRPISDIAYLITFVIAALYAGIAGFSLPTQRALMMLGIGVMVKMMRAEISLSQNLQIVFIISILLYPWCLFDVSFCLSFIAVALIMLAITGRAPSRWRWLRLQFSISLGLMPMTVWVFHKFSLIGLFINCYAIPWVSFIILPASLLSVILLPFPFINAFLIKFISLNITLFHWTLSACLTLPFASLAAGFSSGWQFITAQLFVLLLIAPKGWPGKPLSLFLIPMLLYPQFVKPEIRLTILDVGQGLSVVFQYHDRVLIYDTGPRFGASDAGLRVINPYLQQLHIHRIESLIVSHGDLDHRGGLGSVLKQFPVTRVLSGEPKRLKFPSQPCRRGQQWNWDHIHFKILHPVVNNQGNNSSCVLVIEFNGYRILLPGDIEQSAEFDLSQTLPSQYHTTILVAAHHGSKTSSSALLMKKLTPRYIVFSTGYHNRYRFPHQRVLKDYCVHARCLNTAILGAVQFEFNPELALKTYRQQNEHFWN